MPVSFLSPAQRDSYGQYLGDPCRRWRRPSALASAPDQGQPVESVGRWHEAASGEAGIDRVLEIAVDWGQGQLSADLPGRAAAPWPPSSGRGPFTRRRASACGPANR